MPLHDYECKDCGYADEEMVGADDHNMICPECGGRYDRVYNNFRGIAHEAPDWMRGVLDVVNKEGGPHCQEFLKNPNRKNWKAWMEGEGIRPMEEGEEKVGRKYGKEGRTKEEKIQLRNRLLKRLQKREAITIS